MSDRIMWMSVALVMLATVVSIQLITVAAGYHGADSTMAPAAVATGDPAQDSAELPPIKIGLPF